MRFLIGACALIWAVSTPTAFAASEKLPLTLTEAIALVLENNPQLKAADYNNQAAASRIRQQTQATPWELGVSLENFAGTGEASGVDSLETSLSLGRVLELGRKPQLRGEVASVQASLLQNEQDANRLDLMSETALRFLRIAQVQEQQRLAIEKVKLKQRTLEVVKQRFNAGKAPRAERDRAKIDLARADLEREETDHLLSVAHRNLAILWGELFPRPRVVLANIFDLEPIPDLVTLEQLVEQNPSLVQFTTQQHLAETRLRLAQASRQPDIEINGGVRHLNAEDDVGLLFSVVVPLGSRERAKPRLDEVIALSTREPLLAEDKKLSLLATLHSLQQELIHNQDVINALQESIIPAARSALADTKKGYTAGRYSLLELTQAQNTLLQARREALDTAIDYQRNRIEIDRLTGAALTQTQTTGVNQ